jgi:hypothetical protein
VTDDLRRPRLTVLFRLVLVLPHLIWLVLWGTAVYGATQAAGAEGSAAAAVSLGTAGVAWVVTLFAAHLWPEVHGFHSRFLRWNVHVVAYATLLAQQWPRFDARDPYPIDLAIEPPARQNRWKTAFRIVLAIPALVFSFVLAIVLFVLAIVGWFACLVLGRMPKGMRDLGAYCVRFGGQTAAYLLFLTDRYPAVGSDARPIAPETSVQDNLRKLEELRDAGVLDEEEFQQKRRQLLGPFDDGV